MAMRGLELQLECRSLEGSSGRQNFDERDGFTAALAPAKHARSPEVLDSMELFFWQLVCPSSRNERESGNSIFAIGRPGRRR